MKTAEGIQMFISHQNKECCRYVGGSEGTYMLCVCEAAANLKSNKL